MAEIGLLASGRVAGAAGGEEWPEQNHRIVDNGMIIADEESQAADRGESRSSTLDFGSSMGAESHYGDRTRSTPLSTPSMAYAPNNGNSNSTGPPAEARAEPGHDAAPLSAESATARGAGRVPGTMPPQQLSPASQFYGPDMNMFYESTNGLGVMNFLVRHEGLRWAETGPGAGIEGPFRTARRLAHRSGRASSRSPPPSALGYGMYVGDFEI